MEPEKNTCEDCGMEASKSCQECGKQTCDDCGADHSHDEGGGEDK